MTDRGMAELPRLFFNQYYTTYSPLHGPNLSKLAGLGDCRRFLRLDKL